MGSFRAGEPTYRDLFAAMTRVEHFFFWLAIVNFLSLIVFGFVFGGHAVEGKIDHGHYYLGAKGAYTEVSRTLFVFSKVQLWSLLITHPVGLVAALRARGRWRKTTE